MAQTKAIAGVATQNGTERYAATHQELSYAVLGSTGLLVSAAGFGSYRIEASEPSHEEALTYSLRTGINLIDTSANYTDGGSEQLIGQVLEKLIAQGDIGREQVVVVSKAGYLQGENYQLSQKRKEAGRPFFDLVLAGPDLEHCIHPEFLADQITRSLARLKLKSLDCCLLHNPEYYLNAAKSEGIPVAQAREEYYRRIRQAFLHLEQEVVAGRISSYGISSNTFPGEADDYNFTSLATVWDIAEEISNTHRFRVIEFPLNLLETGAVLRHNQPTGQSLLEFAAEKKLAVLINRPLNAIVDGRLVRLSEKHYYGEGVVQARRFRDKIAEQDEDWSEAKTLSQIALRAIRSTAGISSVLMGMREREYVEDALTELRRPCPVKSRAGSWRKVDDL
ncbi:MAG TPA: aldo/keto reductase [Negativicutes bacterium]|nr:aldo/keto reductase [Negativicutes bacterium]